MPHHDYPDWPTDPRSHGPLWHAAMSVLTIAGIGALLLLAAIVAVPR